MRQISKMLNKIRNLYGNHVFDSHKNERSLVLLLLLGVIVRMGMMPFTMHVDANFTGDIATFPYVVQMWNSPGGGTGGLIYPPLFYHTISFYLTRLVNPFIIGLWDKPILGMEARFDWISSPFVFRNLFILKALYFLPDLGIAYLLWRSYRHKWKQMRLALIFWVFNPVVLFDAYFHGQYDLLPVFFVFLGLFYAKNNRPGWAAFSLGIGACYKNFPFAFLLPLILIMDRTWTGRFKLLIVGVLPYLLLYLPKLNDFSLLGSHLSGVFFPAGYDIGSGGQIYFFFVIYAILLWFIYHHQAQSFDDFWRTSFVILLVYYQFTYFDLHYWIWIIPFALFYLVEHPIEARPFFVVISLFLLVLIVPTPLGRYLAPISPRFFLRLPSPLEALSPYLPILFIVNIVRSLLAGTCFYLAWRVLRAMPASRDQASFSTPELEQSI